MTLIQRIEACERLAKIIRSGEWKPDFGSVNAHNPWFTKDHVLMALKGLLKFLETKKLRTWTNSYRLNGVTEKQVGIIMAGNIPLVGFHDLLCVLISGHRAMVKLSHQDHLLLPSLLEAWSKTSELAQRVEFVSNLDQNVDAVIATGSDNTARYITYQFADIPTIIRGNRTSHAILNGEEDSAVLELLGTDMFSYFGKGCRNVTKLWVPHGYSFHQFINANQRYNALLDNPHYGNNISYQRALLSTLQQQFFDLNYTLLVESPETVSPLGVVYFQHYQQVAGLQKELAAQRNKLQCLVSHQAWFPRSIDMGRAQFPELPDYADNVDTMQFLNALN